MKKLTRNTKASQTAGSGNRDFVELRLYVADEMPRCLTAYENIRKICEKYAKGKYRITVIDLLINPQRARLDNITAIPTLIRIPRTPGRRKIIGTFTDTQKVLKGIDLPTKAAYSGKSTPRMTTLVDLR